MVPPAWNPLLDLAHEILGSQDLDLGWFELGGSSIDGAVMVSRARTEHGALISLVDLLKTNSIVDYIGQNRPGAS